MSEDLLTTPASLDIGDVTVHASATSNAVQHRWTVNIVVVRRPGQEPVDAKDLDVQLLDPGGEVITPLERPKGVLTEAGTSLASSVNATFIFPEPERTPARLKVSFRRREAEFAIESKSPPQ